MEFTSHLLLTTMRNAGRQTLNCYVFNFITAKCGKFFRICDNSAMQMRQLLELFVFVQSTVQIIGVSEI